MPDSFDNWTPDEQFWDDAWSDMQDRLENDQKRGFAPWLLIFMVLLAFGGMFALGKVMSAESTQPATEPPALDETMPPIASDVQTKVPSNNAEKPLETTDASPVLYPVGVNESSSPEPVNTLNTPNNKLLSAEESVGSNIVVGGVDPIVISEDFVEEAIEEHLFSGEIIEPESDRTQSGAKTLSFFISSLDNPLLVPSLDVSGMSVGQAKAGNELVRERRPIAFQLNAMASHGTSSPGFGYGLGFGPTFSLGNAWTLSTELNIRHEQVPLRLGQRSRSQDDATEISQDPGSTDNLSFDQIEQALSQVNLDYGRFVSTGLELRIGKSISNRWAISGGVGGQYMASAFGPRVDTDLSNTFLQTPLSASTRNQTNLDQSLQTILALNQSGQANESELNIFRLQLETFLGVGYQLSKRWQLGLDLRYRTTDLYTDSNFRFG
ncbi:MAG: hypothetical protein AAFR97_08800, partial [Bacteroidota bacterium]